MKYLYASTAAAAIVAFMSDAVPTVIIQTDNGPVIINKSTVDADPDAFTVLDMTIEELEAQNKNASVVGTVNGEPIQPTTFIAPVPVEPPPSAPMFEPAPAVITQPQQPDIKTPEAQQAETQAAAPAQTQQRTVMKTGSKFFVTDLQGNAVTGVEGINEAGYKTQAAAQAALAALSAPAAS